MIKKILVIGFGSIGKRHTQNLWVIGYRSITVVKPGPIDLSAFPGIHYFPSIEAAYAENSYDAVFICTPTARHMLDLEAVWQLGARTIYLEKPISHTDDGVDAFLQKIKKENACVIIGYDLHFDPGIMKVKELLTGGSMGKLLSANAFVGEYLPDWRPHTDYKKGVSALREKGGGVLLDLVHELDYLSYLVGDAQCVSAQYINSGTLEIETEELAEVLVKFRNGAFATVHLDYLQPMLVRNCRFTCTAGSILWDLVEANVQWINRAKESFSFSYQGFQRNDRFREIIKAFLENPGDSRLTHYEQGLKSLYLAVAAKQAAEKDTCIFLPLL